MLMRDVHVPWRWERLDAGSNLLTRSKWVVVVEGRDVIDADIHRPSRSNYHKPKASSITAYSHPKLDYINPVVDQTQPAKYITHQIYHQHVHPNPTPK